MAPPQPQAPVDDDPYGQSSVFNQGWRNRQQNNLQIMGVANEEEKPIFADPAPAPQQTSKPLVEGGLFSMSELKEEPKQAAAPGKSLIGGIFDDSDEEQENFEEVK